MSCKKTSIGGQALIEGIMMRGPVTSAMAVRLPDGTIDTETWPTNKSGTTPWYKKAYFIRGIFNMVDTLKTGFGCLMKSADKAGIEEEEPTKFEKGLAKLLGANVNNVMNTVAIILGVGLAILLFIVIPTGAASLLRPVLPGTGFLALVERLQALDIDLVVLAGFLHILTAEMVAAYPNAILNVHPALIPSFCGKGAYGLHVHEQALAYGVKVTGATVHFVNEEPDGGPIVLQKAVSIREGDTPELLQRRVMEEAEWIILPQAVSLFCQDRLSVEGRIVHIKEV